MPTVLNRGRLNNFISGITGVAPGGTAVINMPVNLRAHRLNFQTSGIAYGLNGTTVTAVPTVADAGATFTVTTNNGVITAINIVGAVSTKGNGTYALTILGGLYTNPDGTTTRLGTGATATYTVTGTTVVSSTTVTNSGAVGFVPPELMINSFKQLVNGVNMRDISVLNIRKIMYANPLLRNYTPQLGEFPVFFTEPWRNELQHNEVTSWDLFGQNTWQIQVGIVSTISSPSLIGSYEFDYFRNTRPQKDAKGNKVDVPFLQPVRQHQFQYPVPGGRFDLTTLPIDYPISRLWMYETDQTTGAFLGKGSIFQIEIYQDGNKVMEATQPQIDQQIAEYGFNWNIFDVAFIADPDQRLFKALKVANNLIVRVYSLAAANLTVVQETLPGSYS